MNIKIPLSWIREYVKTDITAKTLANALSLSGPSVEKIEKRGNELIFELEVTTNRTDAYSIFGIARESNAILNAQSLKSSLVKPGGLNLNLDPDKSKPLLLDIVIKDKNLCPRFTAIIVDNIKIQPSPAYIRNRLSASGIRAINNIVDISNYIMLELGQPMHTFDFDKIKGAKMTLRKSQKGESIKTLDGNIHKLPEGSIVIEDSERLIDLCGIMGGLNSTVSRRTKRVLLFTQAYNAQAIRKTTQALAFRTEAASRFEKGIDLEGVLPALSRAVYLAKQTAGAQIASELIDIYPDKQKSKTFRLNFNKLNNYLGINLEQSKSVQILKSLGFQTKQNPNQIVVTVPSWRTQDIESDVDLIEEIARIYGYHKLPSKLPTGETPQTKESDLKEVISLKNALKYLGLTEVITYSIISKNLLKVSKRSEKNSVELTNPLTEEWQFMRPTIIPSLLKVISENRHLSPSANLARLAAERAPGGTSDIRLFEVAKTYLPQKNNLPKQDLMLAICLADANFYQAKGVVENICNYLQRKMTFAKLSKNHPLLGQNQSAEIKSTDEIIGTIGAVKEEILNQFEISTKTYAIEINLTKIYQLPSSLPQYHPIPKYPPVIEDISAVVATVLPLEEIIDEVKKSGTPLINKVDVVDIFENEKLGENKKSVTLRLTFQKTSGTPTLDEANQVKEKIISHLEKTFRAKVRK